MERKEKQTRNIKSAETEERNSEMQNQAVHFGHFKQCNTIMKTTQEMKICRQSKDVL